jgi:hypothetical protein
VNGRVLLAALVVGGSLLVGAAPAQAKPIGTIVIFPGASIDTAPVKVFTSGGCPVEADAYVATAKGHGFPADGQVVTASTDAGMSRKGGFYVYFAETMKDFADDNHTTLTGRYDITVSCIDSFTQNSFGEFTGAMQFSSPKSYEAVGAAKPTSSATPAAGEPVRQPPVFPSVAGSAGAEAADPTGRDGSPGNRLGRWAWVAVAAVAVLGAFLYGRRGRRRAAPAPEPSPAPEPVPEQVRKPAAKSTATARKRAKAKAR